MEIIQKDPESEEQILIPGLPNEVSTLCLLHLPYPYQALARSISSSMNKAITHPSFLLYKKSLSLSKPYLFVLASHKSSTATMQWHALDLSSNRWFLLPSMPSPTPSPPNNTLACASLPRHGQLIVIMNTCTYIYRACTNQWSTSSSPMPTSGPHLAAAEVNGKVITVDSVKAQVAVYDSEKDTWEGSSGHVDIGRCEDCAVMGGRVYVTEGWRWPFKVGPRGAVYDVARGRWGPMGRGMREGWTGVSGVVGGRMVVVGEYGESEVKVYDEGRDGWDYVEGDRFPRERLERPLRVRGEGGRIYVVGAKMNVAIGSVQVEVDGKVKIRWQVVEAPREFEHFIPSHCHVLYA